MTKHSEARIALAEAVAGLNAADCALKDARAATTNATQRHRDARDVLDELRERPVSKASADAVIAGLASGSLDVLTLDRPQVELREAIEKAEREYAAWGSARDLAEQAIPGRQTAVAFARMKAESAARELVLAEVPIAALLGEAEAVAADLAAKRAVLRAVMSALDHTTPEAKAIDRFLSPAPSDAFNGRAENHPAAQPWLAAFKALLNNPDMPLPG
jgi:hypothetical protein